jgi:hypothetical protein
VPTISLIAARAIVIDGKPILDTLFPIPITYYLQPKGFAQPRIF